MNVRRGMVSRALSLGVCGQDSRESVGFADTNRNPAISAQVAAGEHINAARFANWTIKWLNVQRIADA
jgi:hypothetical protein